MNYDLIKEYVSLVLEKVRTTKKGSSFGNKFDIRKFKSLKDIKEMNAYADSFLEKLGQGSSRAAYILSSSKVLKIAVNKKGVAQNKTEMDVFTNPQTKPMISKIVDYDPEYTWLLADSVREFKSERDFEVAAKIRFGDFIDEVRSVKAGKSETNNQLVMNTVNTMNSTDLLIGDIAIVEHWGKSADGRVVLLDYGFTKEVWEKYYQPGLESTEDKEDLKATEKNTQGDEIETRKLTLKTLKRKRPNSSYNTVSDAGTDVGSL
jgi:hypothetical protein